MGSWQKGTPSDRIPQYLTAGQVAIDVGAADGGETTLMLKLVGETGHVYSLDAHPDYAERLHRLDRPSLTILHRAAWSTTETRPFYVSAEQSSLYRVNIPKEETILTVQTIRLDDVTEQPVSFVKIDAQGAEVEILRGAPRLLATCPAWILELWPSGLEGAGTSGRELVTILRDAGLTPRWFDGTPITDEDYDAWEGTGKHFVNILATR